MRARWRRTAAGGLGVGGPTVKVWDLESGRAMATLEGHALGVTACAVTPDGRRVVSASEDQTLKVWDLETGARWPRWKATPWG
jgi:WD40 repeat protein